MKTGKGICLSLALLAVFILSSCSPTQKETSRAQDQTSLTETIIQTISISTPEPRITPTTILIDIPTSTPYPLPVPLSSINLENILILPGDLPAGYSGAQVRIDTPLMFTSFPKPDNLIQQQLQKDNKLVGWVVGFLYKNLNDRQIALSYALDSFGDSGKSYEGIGEQAISYSLDIGSENLIIGKIQSVDFAFVRCNAFVYIRMDGTTDIEDAASYAKRLDGRLNAEICNDGFTPPPTFTPIFTQTPLPRMGISARKIMSDLELLKIGCTFEAPKIIEGGEFNGFSSFLCAYDASRIVVELISLDDNLAEAFMVIDLSQYSNEVTDNVKSNINLLLSSVLPDWKESSSWLETSISDAIKSGKVITQQGNINIELEIDTKYGNASLLITTNRD